MVESTKPSPDALLKAAEKLSPRQLDRFLNGLLHLRAKRHAPHLSPQETKLLLRINKGIPEAQRKRYDELSAKRRAETLTDHEHRELIGISDAIEMLSAKRLEALIALAKLRHVSLDSLMNDLGITTPEYE